RRHPSDAAPASVDGDVDLEALAFQALLVDAAADVAQVELAEVVRVVDGVLPQELAPVDLGLVEFLDEELRALGERALALRDLLRLHGAVHRVAPVARHRLGVHRLAAALALLAVLPAA